MNLLLAETASSGLAGSGLLGATTDRPLVLVLTLAAVSLLPFAALMVTSFAKIAVVLGITRSALGTPQIPPTSVVTGLSLILSVYVMAPVAEQVHQRLDGLSPLGDGQVLTAGRAAVEPLRGFLLAHADPEDRVLFLELARSLRTAESAAALSDTDLVVAVPAFVVTELREAFRVGFLVFLPFLVVDLVVSVVLLSLGMHMLSPTTVSLPFKLLLFVAADGWRLLAEALVGGYAV